MAETGGRIVGDYIVGPQKIGSGSFSDVWRGRDRRSGTVVAVKEIDKRKLNGKMKDSLLKEIAILSQVSHPNIVKLHQAIQTEDWIYLILEYCIGGDLAAYIHRHGIVSESVARHFMRQLASGLQVLRENNLIHRDLKPQNLLLCTKDETPLLKIGDFGFARSLMPKKLADTICGSPLYMAPEIIENKQYDAKADLWSVGAILYQLVTGKPPFDGKTQTQLFQNVLASDEPQFPKNVKMNLSYDCINLCRSLLRRNPVERLAFEEFFSHKFMALPRTSESAHELTQKTANINLENTFGELSNTAALSMKYVASSQALLTESTPKVADSFEYIEREYVLVPAHSPSMETLSSPFKMSLRENATAKIPSCTQKNIEIDTSSLKQSGELAISTVCGAERMGSQMSASSSVSRASASVDVAETSSLNSLGRLRFLCQCANALTELAQEKLNAGLHLDCFSVELVILALWKEALRACNLWISSTIVADPRNRSSASGSSHQKDEQLHPKFEAVDFMSPVSVCSWVEQGFILAYDRAEKVSNDIRDTDGNLEMPDAMEIIFQAALSAGKTGAVDELMNKNKWVESYFKAITLLSFILTEAHSLSLSPPFSLSSSDQQHIHKYIMRLKAHVNQSHVKQPQGSLGK